MNSFQQQDGTGMIFITVRSPAIIVLVVNLFREIYHISHVAFVGPWLSCILYLLSSRVSTSLRHRSETNSDESLINPSATTRQSESHQAWGPVEENLNT